MEFHTISFDIKIQPIEEGGRERESRLHPSREYSFKDVSIAGKGLPLLDTYGL